MKVIICKFFKEKDVERKISGLVDRGNKQATNIRIFCSSDRIRKTFDSLITNYLADDSDGIIKHGCYHKPENVGVDESTIWGDYHFVKALNLKRDHPGC